MLRAVLGTILGYVVMFVVLTAVLFGVYFAIGMERSFQPESYAPSMLWIVLMFASGLLAAVIGGFIAMKIGGAGSIKGMLVVIILLSAVDMGLQLSKEDAPEVRGPEVTAMEAGVKARPPVWVMVVNPLIGVLGVILGSRVAGKRAQ